MLSGIDVSVSDGEATLTGTVAKERLPDVMKIAMEADIKKINNKLSVKNSGAAGFSYPYRQNAMAALGKQKDGRAVAALRRVLYEVNGYERSIAVSALLDCGGFTVPEQMAALEAAAKRANDQEAASGGKCRKCAAGLAIYTVEELTLFSYLTNKWPTQRPITDPEIKDLLGQQLMQAEEISDEFARALVDRIEVLDEKDPRLAASFRALILRWQNAVIDMLLLKDVKRGVADEDTIIRVLSQRKNLREKLPNDVSDLQNGKPMARALLRVSLKMRAIMRRSSTMPMAKQKRRCLPVQRADPFAAALWQRSQKI